MAAKKRGPRVAIVDYGMGNLYSVEHACRHAGADAVITTKPDEIAAADGVVLPGVGAMPDAMTVLRQSGLDKAIAFAAGKGTPLLGICLGMQLLMREGTEFGPHEGLGLVEGGVQRFEGTEEDGSPLKVPHIGWNAVRQSGEGRWAGSLMQDAADGTYMYYVHSYYVVPRDPGIRVAATRYGDTDFCAAFQQGNLFACQFHPERSGPQGLLMIRNFVAWSASRAGAPASP
jgi:glutamine amidotransferase